MQHSCSCDQILGTWCLSHIYNLLRVPQSHSLALCKTAFASTFFTHLSPTISALSADLHYAIYLCCLSLQLTFAVFLLLMLRIQAMNSERSRVAESHLQKGVCLAQPGGSSRTEPVEEPGLSAGREATFATAQAATICRLCSMQ